MQVSDREPVDLRTDSEYSGRVQYHCGKNGCTLRISDLRERDSAEYKFMFTTNLPGGSVAGEPGVTLSVTDPDLQVQVKPIVHQGDTKAELKCHSACRLPDHPSYIWYKSGQEIEAQTSSFTISFELTDSYTCALKGREDFPSPSVCVYGQHCHRVLYTEKSVCAFKGSSVDIYCTYSSDESITSKFWFSPECSHQWQSASQPEDLSTDSQYTGRVQVIETWRGFSTLRISDLRERDSAEYHFKFRTPRFEWRSSLPGTTLTVTDPDMQVQVRRYRYNSWAELKCHSRCRLPDHPSYIWYKNGQKVQKTTLYYSDYFGSADSYSCAVKGHEDFPSPSESLQVKVNRNIVYPSYTYAELTCHSSCSPADRLSYVWFKNGARIMKEESSSYKDRLYLGDSISCALKGHDNYRSLAVYALKVPYVSVSPSGEIMENTSVTLTCSSDANPATTYTWYMEEQKLLNKEPHLVFSSVQSSDSGEYYCAAENELGKRTSEYIFINVKYAPKHASVLVSPSAEIVEGSSMTLTCSSDANPAAKYTWYKENQTLLQGPEDIYHFPSISSEDRGNYHCKSENQHGELASKSVFIDVQYGPKLPSVSVSPSAEIVEGSSVNLTCSSDANPAANYTWYKENEDSPKASGQIFTITDFRDEHSGNYYCEAQNRRGSQNSTLHLIVVAERRGLPSNHLSLKRDQNPGNSI
ncbi:B-cell receptor CD22 [Perca flavescens]|uniref:B-cell receptor CD22 n=1 Tax=Perca flavescens TaxID=8167 RepID=UPI00106E38FF|nr:B-cell receptor CD22-like [Perca flavescens]